GLGAGFEAEVVGLAEVEDFLDDVALLVDLDRVDAAVSALVVELVDGALEGGVDLADAVTEDVGEAEENGKLDAARLQLIDEFFEVDGLVGPLVRMHRDVAGLADGEVSLAPLPNAIGFRRIGNLPFFHQFHQGWPSTNRGTCAFRSVVVVRSLRDRKTGP